MISRQNLKLLAVFILLMTAGVVIGIYTEQYYRERSTPAAMEGVFWPNPKQIAAFNMIDQEGNEFGIGRLKGKWTFMFFGYTHCPDVCPITMAILNDVYKRITAEGAPPPGIQVVFVSVDPARDNPSRLDEFIGYFNDDFIALGGSPAQLDSLASQIGIAYSYGPPQKDGNYLVQHTSSIFLLDPDARLVSIFSPPLETASIQSRFAEIEAFIRRQE